MKKEMCGKLWCSKLVCKCTHEWEIHKQADVNSCTAEAPRCPVCDYWPWVYSKPVYYRTYKKHVEV